MSFARCQECCKPLNAQEAERASINGCPRCGATEIEIGDAEPLTLTQLGADTEWDDECREAVSTRQAPYDLSE